MENKSYTPEEIRKKFDTLPADIKAMIYSADMLNAIQTIGTKHQLHVDQLGTLEAETADVMSGFTKPEEFTSQLAVSLKLEPTKAEAVARDISDQLFTKIRESLKQLYGQGVAASTLTPQRSEISAPPAPVIPRPAPAPGSLAQKLPVTPPAPPPPTAPAPVAPSMKPSIPSAPTAPAAPVAKPQVPLAPHPHDLTLVEKTITTPATPPKTAPAPTPNATAASAAPQKPANYTADPYREPVEP